METLQDVSSFDSPQDNPYGLAWDGTSLWIAIYTGDIYNVQTNGTIITSWTPPRHINGLTFDGTYLWGSAPGGASVVYKFQTNGTEVDSWGAPESTIYGLAWDGTYLWLVGVTNKKIYKLQTDGTEVSSFDVPSATTPYGLTWDGTHLWYADRTYIYQIETDGTLVETYSLSPTPDGLTWDGYYYWTSDTVIEKIYQLSLVARKGAIAMSTDATGTTWYAWLSGSDLIVNRLASETPTAETAITVDGSGDYDAVADVQYTGSFIRVVVRKSSDEKPYAFQSTDFGSNWTGPTDIS